MKKGSDRAWVEVELDNIAHNFKEIRKIVDKNTMIMGVVKADAYGHGAAEVARVLVKSGADRLAVATIDEAIELREKGITVPVQVLSHTFPPRASEIVKYDLIQTVYDRELAEGISAAAVANGKKSKIHIKVNTGMNRVGFIPGREAIEKVGSIAGLAGIEIEGIMTHFASADEADSSYTELQFEKFLDFCRQLEENGIKIPVRHVSNSAAILHHRHMNLEMVRPGIALYGLYPSLCKKCPDVELRPAMVLKARIISLSDINKGEYLSYGRTFQSKRESRMATLAIGYADGYSRNLSNRARVLVNREFAPLVGRICMDQCIVDVTDVASDVRVGDEVVLFGQSGSSSISADEIAGLLDTISYEVVSRMGVRLPRMYEKD